MPVPRPRPGEDQRGFMSRCVNFLVDEGKETEQAVAICYSQITKTPEAVEYFRVQKKRRSFYRDNYKRVKKALLESVEGILKQSNIEAMKSTPVDPKPVEKALKKLYMDVGDEFFKDGRRRINKIAKKHQQKADVEFDYRARLESLLRYNWEKSSENINFLTSRKITYYINAGVQGELGIDGIVKMITKYVENMSAMRARRITRTEVVSASNAASLEGARSTKLKFKKKWISIIDARTRRANKYSSFDHIVMNGVIVNEDELFSLGGGVVQTATRYNSDMEQEEVRIFGTELMDAPGDRFNGASPGNYINCRCTLGYVDISDAVIDYEVTPDKPRDQVDYVAPYTIQPGEPNLEQGFPFDYVKDKDGNERKLILEEPLINEEEAVNMLKEATSLFVEKYNTTFNKDELFRLSIAEANDFTQLPGVASSEEFERLINEESYIEVHRGVGPLPKDQNEKRRIENMPPGADKKAAMENFESRNRSAGAFEFVHGDYYPGEGMYGDGIYAVGTNDYENTWATARGYSMDNMFSKENEEGKTIYNHPGIINIAFNPGEVRLIDHSRITSNSNVTKYRSIISAMADNYLTDLITADKEQEGESPLLRLLLQESQIRILPGGRYKFTGDLMEFVDTIDNMSLTLTKKERRAFEFIRRASTTLDEGVMAATLGYDAIRVSHTDYFVILNRAKLIVRDINGFRFNASEGIDYSWSKTYWMQLRDWIDKNDPDWWDENTVINE